MLGGGQINISAETFYPFSCNRDDTVGENAPASGQYHQTLTDHILGCDRKSLQVLGNLLVLHAQRLHDLPLVFSRTSLGCSFTLLSL